jgi:PadR family transcriptional regulator, regulatory protein AphA
MSLRHALLDLLAAGEPMSGYDLAQEFSASLANVWPAQHSQIYPELARLAAEGLIVQTGEGPRGRKVYEATPAGVQALRTWLLESEPDYGVRSEAFLRSFALWTLTAEEALAQLARDRAEYSRHLEDLDAAIATVDWSTTPSMRGRRLAIEFGHRFFTQLVEWADWASGQVEGGLLEPGGPIPPPPWEPADDTDAKV